jgi:hypothetical protein
MSIQDKIEEVIDARLNKEACFSGGGVLFETDVHDFVTNLANEIAQMLHEEDYLDLSVANATGDTPANGRLPNPPPSNPLKLKNED